MRKVSPKSPCRCHSRSNPDPRMFEKHPKTLPDKFSGKFSRKFFPKDYPEVRANILKTRKKRNSTPSLFAVIAGGKFGVFLLLFGRDWCQIPKSNPEKSLSMSRMCEKCRKDVGILKSSIPILPNAANPGRVRAEQENE